MFSHPLSLRAYAKRRGVCTKEVSRAVSVGRLVKSIVLVAGAPKIADPDLADVEWLSNKRPRGGQSKLCEHGVLGKMRCQTCRQ